MSNFKHTVQSVLFAFLGVQSDSNRERDFTKGKFSHFAIVGFIACVLFVLALVAIVSLVIPALS